MTTYTTPQAAELTGSSVRALRKRIERGQLHAIQHGRYWKIPRSELERLGMLDADPTTGDDVGPVLAELARERAERDRLTRELARLRPLTVRVEQMTARLSNLTEDLHHERAERQLAEARAAEALRVIGELRISQQAHARPGSLPVAACCASCASARRTAISLPGSSTCAVARRRSS